MGNLRREIAAVLQGSEGIRTLNQFISSRPPKQELLPRSFRMRGQRERWQPTPAQLTGNTLTTEQKRLAAPVLLAVTVAGYLGHRDIANIQKLTEDAHKKIEAAQRKSASSFPRRAKDDLLRSAGSIRRRLEDRLGSEKMVGIIIGLTVNFTRFYRLVLDDFRATPQRIAFRLDLPEYGIFSVFRGVMGIPRKLRVGDLSPVAE
jgi:hypothetical protein